MNWFYVGMLSMTGHWLYNPLSTSGSHGTCTDMWFSNLKVAYEKCRRRAPRVVSVYTGTDEQIACAIFWWIPFQIIQLITHNTLWIGISCCLSMGTQWWHEVVRTSEEYCPQILMFWHEAILPLLADLQVQESLNIPPPKFCHTQNYLILHMTWPLWPATLVHFLRYIVKRKSSSIFSATDISRNIVWLLLLHDTIQIESNYTWINYNRDNIATRSHMMIYNFVWNFILIPNLVAFISQ